MRPFFMRSTRPTAFCLLLAAGPALFLTGALARLIPAGARPLCLTHVATGLPCPGCGSFRALCLFTAGHWREAWFMQPLMTLLYTAVALLSAAAMVGWLFRISTPPFRPLTRREHVLLLAGAALAVFLNWLYLLADRR
jgi:hypothetical protein